MKRKKLNKETFDNAILLTRFPLIFNLNILLFLLIKKIGVWDFEDFSACSPLK